MKILISVMFLALSTICCASFEQSWTKPGHRDGDFGGDYAICVHEAMTAVPVMKDIIETNMSREFHIQSCMRLRGWEPGVKRK